MSEPVQERICEGADFTLHRHHLRRRVSATRRLFIVFLVPFLMQLAPPATSQALPDKHPITAVGDPVPQAKLDPEPIRLPIVDGTEIRFRRLSTSEGLLQTKVAQIVQDNEGFMWFGTQHGLNRYDGYSLRVFVNDPGDPNSLSGVPIGALFKDRDGTLWIGCDQFLNRFDRSTEKFTRFPVPLVKHISQDTAGVLWLATPTGLYGLHPATARVRRYAHDPDDPRSLSNNDIQSSGEDKWKVLGREFPGTGGVRSPNREGDATNSVARTFGGRLLLRRSRRHILDLPYHRHKRLSDV